MVKKRGKFGGGLVLVEWLDSRQPTSAWVRVGDLQRECCWCYSVGFVVQRDRKVVVLAPNVSDTDDYPQAIGAMVIPRAAVMGITQLNITKRKRRAALDKARHEA